MFSLSHTYVLSHASLNQARIGFVRTNTKMEANAPFKWSDVGVSEGDMNKNNELPSLNILGSVSMAPVLPRTYTQNSFVFNDVLSFLKGPHALKVGGSLTRLEDNLDFAGAASFVQFLSWPDFLLGLDASSNGTEIHSNVFQSSDLFGLLNREFRVWEGSAFAQDDYRIRRSLTLNLGARYERLGQFGDQLGRNSSFDVNKANANPPPSGSLDGYIVASNFPGALPAGVARCEQYVWKLWRRTKHDCSSNRLRLASLAMDKSVGFARRVRYLLLSDNRPCGCSIRAGSAVFLDPNQHWTDERRRDISSTLCTAISNADFISDVCTLFSNHERLGQCSSPKFSASNRPTILTKRPGRISQRLVAGGRVRRRPGNSSATLPFPESSAWPHLHRVRSGMSLRTRWPILGYGFPFLEYVPILFARWNPLGTPGITGSKLAWRSGSATAFSF